MSSSEHTLSQLELPTMTFLPPYEAASPATYPRRPPTAFLPNYSHINPSPWWEEAAEAAFRQSHDFNLIILILKFIPFSDPTIPARLLSGRQKGWLDAFLNVLCRDKAINVPTCNSVLSTAETIVVIINRRPSSHTPQWRGDWLLSALLDTDISTVADELDIQMHSVFCTITYADWIAWRCGYRTDTISNFLDALLNFRNTLVQFAQEHRIVADRLLTLQKALPSRQPLLHWMISTAVRGDTLSDPADALRFFLKPIAQQFEGQCLDISRVCQRISILDARFRLKVIHATDPKWPIPFSIDFSVWESIQKYNPQELAESNTRSVEKLFSGISVRDLDSDDGYLKDVARTWSDYSDDFLACLSTDKELIRYFMHLAENFIRLRNLFSAAAVGLALSKWGYQPRRSSSPVWDTINPKDNFAGCRRFMAKNPTCLAYLFPYIQELRRSGNAPEKTLEFYQMFLGHLNKSQEAKVGQIKRVKAKTLKRGIINCTYSPCQTMQLQGHSVHECDRDPSQTTSISLCYCKGIESFATFRKLPIEIRHLIWEESLPEPRIFDDVTLRVLRPRHGVICLDLIPSILQLCQDSRAFAQSRLRRTILFQTWPPNSNRVIYFDPKRDIYSCVEIVANTSPDQLTDTFGYGLRSMQFYKKFPHLKRLVITNRHKNLLGDILRNGWSEARWNHESRLNQRKWDQEWKFVRDYFEGREISITTSSSIPQADRRQPADTTCVLNAQRDECVDTETNFRLSSKPELISLISTRKELSPRTKVYSQASPQYEMSQDTTETEFEKQGEVDLSAIACHGRNFSTLDLDITPGPAPLTTEHLVEYKRANGSYAKRVLQIYDEQSSDGSEATEATEVAPENEIKAMIERNFPVSSKQGKSDGIAAKIEYQAHSSIQEFAKPCREQGAHGFDRKKFDSNEYLIFSPPEWVWSLADMQLSDDNATSSFAVSGAFPLFSAAAIERMREELLTNKVQQRFQTSNSTIVRRRLRGMAPKHAEFTYNAWSHPKTLAAISEVAGIDLVPVMDIEVSHLNILGSSNSLRNKHSVDWHRDDYPYACVLMLSDTTHISEGHTLLKMGSGAIAFCDCPKMGFAYVLQGHCIEHAIQAFEGCSELIISITSFRPRNPFLHDQTQLSNVHTISDSLELRLQFCQYRWAIAIERMAALRQLLDGKEVPGWVWNSSLLGENFEEIRRFLQETREQLGMTGNNAPIPTKSKSNAIDLTNCATKKLNLYSFGLCQGIERLALGVQQQQDKTGFDARLGQSTFERVDYILRNTCESVGA